MIVKIRFVWSGTPWEAFSPMTLFVGRWLRLIGKNEMKMIIVTKHGMSFDHFHFHGSGGLILWYNLRLWHIMMKPVMPHNPTLIPGAANQRRQRRRQRRQFPARLFPSHRLRSPRGKHPRRREGRAPVWGGQIFQNHINETSYESFNKNMS